MDVMRIEKNQNYTVMANYHLRDKGISLKAKGLMSLMLSLPEEWGVIWFQVSGFLLGRWRFLSVAQAYKDSIQ